MEGTVKIDILKFRKDIGEPPNRPSGPHRICGIRVFLSQTKVLAWGKFTSSERLNRRRVKVAFSSRNPKRESKRKNSRRLVRVKWLCQTIRV